jgi:hypothetical protein
MWMLQPNNKKCLVKLAVQRSDARPTKARHRLPTTVVTSGLFWQVLLRVEEGVGRPKNDRQVLLGVGVERPKNVLVRRVRTFPDIYTHQVKDVICRRVVCEALVRNVGCSGTNQVYGALATAAQGVDGYKYEVEWEGFQGPENQKSVSICMFLYPTTACHTHTHIHTHCHIPS